MNAQSAWRQLLIGGLALVSLALGATTSHAQTVLGRVALPRLALTPAKGTLTLGEETTVKLTLLDPRGNPFTTNTELKLTLTLTLLESLDAAKKKLAESKAQPYPFTAPTKQALLLAADKENIQATCAFPAGARELVLRIRSYRPGRVRFFVEADKFAPGAAIVSVLSSAKKAALPADFRVVPALWQGAPAAAAPANGAGGFSLEIEPVGLTQYADLGSGMLIDQFYVWLNDQNGEPCLAGRPIDIRLSVNRVSAAATFNKQRVKIEKNEAQTLQPVELRAQTLGQVRLVAAAIQDTRVRSFELPWQIEPPFKATGLALFYDRQSVLASGLDGIKLTIKPGQKLADGSERFLRPEEEGLTQREILLELDKGFGFEFAKGQNKVVIPQDKESADVVVYGKRHTADLKVTARSSGFSGQAVGETHLSFYWPWLYLLWAALGGLGYRLLTYAQDKGKSYLIWGTIFGVICFCFACWGAIALGKVTLGGWDVEIAKVPLESPIAPPILGFVFSWVAAKGAPTG